MSVRVFPPYQFSVPICCIRVSDDLGWHCQVRKHQAMLNTRRIPPRSLPFWKERLWTLLHLTLLTIFQKPPSRNGTFHNPDYTVEKLGLLTNGWFQKLLSVRDSTTRGCCKIKHWTEENYKSWFVYKSGCSENLIIHHILLCIRMEWKLVFFFLNNSWHFFLKQLISLYNPFPVQLSSNFGLDYMLFATVLHSLEAIWDWAYGWIVQGFSCCFTSCFFYASCTISGESRPGLGH